MPGIIGIGPGPDAGKGNPGLNIGNGNRGGICGSIGGARRPGGGWGSSPMGAGAIDWEVGIDKLGGMVWEGSDTGVSV